jgi:hypothetical protein
MSFRNVFMQSSDKLQKCVYAKQRRASPVYLCKTVTYFSSVFLQNSEELHQCVYAMQ